MKVPGSFFNAIGSRASLSDRGRLARNKRAARTRLWLKEQPTFTNIFALRAQYGRDARDPIKILLSLAQRQPEKLQYVTAGRFPGQLPLSFPRRSARGQLELPVNDW